MPGPNEQTGSTKWGWARGVGQSISNLKAADCNALEDGEGARPSDARFRRRGASRR